nr:hypothetical protein [Luteitalea pratensis]
MGLAVPIVAVYMLLNLVVLAWGLLHLWQEPTRWSAWWTAATRAHGHPTSMVVMAALLFPRLALGLSGFETGVAVMPLVQRDPGDPEQHPQGRIRKTKKLLTAAAVLMSVLLAASSVVTTLRIPPAAFAEGGPAYGRALAYIAHEHLGEAFRTVYDLSTVAILWFAGASAGVGEGAQAAGDDFYGSGLPGHDSLQGGCQRPRGRICNRSAGPNGVRRGVSRLPSSSSSPSS